MAGEILVHFHRSAPAKPRHASAGRSLHMPQQRKCPVAIIFTSQVFAASEAIELRYSVSSSSGVGRWRNLPLNAIGNHRISKRTSCSSSAPSGHHRAEAAARLFATSNSVSPATPLTADGQSTDLLRRQRSLPAKSPPHRGHRRYYWQRRIYRKIQPFSRKSVPTAKYGGKLLPVCRVLVPLVAPHIPLRR